MNYAQTKITVLETCFPIWSLWGFWQLTLLDYSGVYFIVSRKCHFNHEQLSHSIYEGKY